MYLWKQKQKMCLKELSSLPTFSYWWWKLNYRMYVLCFSVSRNSFNELAWFVVFAYKPFSFKRQFSFCFSFRNLASSVQRYQIKTVIFYVCTSTDTFIAKQRFVSVRLHSIHRIKKVLKNRTDGPIVHIISKDFRKLTLELPDKNRLLKEMCDVITKYAFPPVKDLFAFKLKEEFKGEFDGWNIYNAVEDYTRLNLHEGNWRLSDWNLKHQAAETYPERYFKFNTFFSNSSFLSPFFNGIVHF